MAEQHYHDLPDRRLAFDHVIATATGICTVVIRYGSMSLHG
jgi:hypothetical protein